MAFNPSAQGEPLSAPTNGRKNTVNDPKFENQVGYYPYDLSHTEVLSPLYGLITPSMHLITSMGDRHVVRDDNKLILNKIQGNFLNTLNQYVDSFFVSNRTMFPNNWDKLIPNPVKGDDLPNSARPVVPLYHFLREFLYGDTPITVRYVDDLDEVVTITFTNSEVLNSDYITDVESGKISNMDTSVQFSYALANIMFLSYIMSRGQLLDYLGIQFDLGNTRDYKSSLQYRIDVFYNALWNFLYQDPYSQKNIPVFPVDLTDGSTSTAINDIIDVQKDVGDYSWGISTLSEFRDRYMTYFEQGKLFWVDLRNISYDGESGIRLVEAFEALRDSLESILPNSIVESILDVNVEPDFNSRGEYINISKALAYQLCVAQYFTNDSVDNIFTSDLYMQLLRSVMFPSVNGMSNEPTFDYNGVPTEYDLISYGAWYRSFFNQTIPGVNARRFIAASLLFILRRSLRYGDYFTTGRTRMLAVGQLSVPVDGEMSVNPVDITLGLVTQRYLNAANRVGSKPIAYYASVMGVTPSDMPSIPHYVSHRKIELQNRVTTNTADNQGEQTTNLVGYSDNQAYDVFIDDYGILLSVNSFDCLPIYTSGVDSDNYLSDRFEYFNPMMQNIGDQPIRLSELRSGIGNYEKTFAYTVRNAEYKYKLSKAHGNMCYNMPGFLLRFPTYQFDDLYAIQKIEHINPDFIRDKPSILDDLISFNIGASPGDYYHFIIGVHNEVKSARLIQRAPGVLF